MYWTEFTIFFNIANVPYFPTDFSQYTQFVHLLPQNCRPIGVDDNEGVPLCCINARCMSVVARSVPGSHFAVGVVWENVLLHGMQFFLFKTRINPCVNEYTLLAWVHKIL